MGQRALVDFFPGVQLLLRHDKRIRHVKRRDALAVDPAAAQVGEDLDHVPVFDEVEGLVLEHARGQIQALARKVAIRDVAAQRLRITRLAIPFDQLLGAVEVGLGLADVLFGFDDVACRPAPRR